MARQHDRNRVPTVGRTDRPDGFRTAYRLSLLTVGPRLTEGDAGQSRPGSTLKLGPREVEGNIELSALSRKVLLKLRSRRRKDGMVVGLGMAVLRLKVFTRLLIEQQTAQTPIRGNQAQTAYR